MTNSPHPREEESEVSLVVKYALFALNVLFWVIGVCTLAIGIYARTIKSLSALGSTLPWFMDPAILFIIFGSIIFILAFLGCIGALRENIVILQIFEYSIDFIMLLEIGLAIYVYVDRSRVKSSVESLLKKTISKYRDDVDLQSIIDYVQENVKCCGVANYNDWELNVYFNCSSPGNEACGVPYSCCRTTKELLNTQCGYKIRNPLLSTFNRSKTIYTDGCVDATLSMFLNEDNLYLIVAVAAAVVVIQIIATGLSHRLIMGVRRQKAKWSRHPQPRWNSYRNDAYNH